MQPTFQQIALVNAAAKTAKEGFSALADLQTWLTSVQFSPSASGIAAADWSTPDVPGSLSGFNPADFANLATAVGQIVAVATGPLSGDASITVGQAFAALAERG